MTSHGPTPCTPLCTCPATLAAQHQRDYLQAQRLYTKCHRTLDTLTRANARSFTSVLAGGPCCPQAARPRRPARDARHATRGVRQSSRPPPAARRSDELDVLTHQPAPLAHLPGRSGARAGLPTTEPGRRATSRH